MQTSLVGEEAKKAWDNALEEAAANSPYFKPEVGKEYELTFSGWTIGMLDFPKKDNAGNKLKGPDGNDLKESKLTLTLWIDSVNGKSCRDVQIEGDPHPGKRWNSTSKKVRESLRMVCQNGNILKKKWGMMKTGSGFQTSYSFSDNGDRE